MRSVLLVTVLIVAAGRAYADDAARIEQLENRVAVLEKQVARLLGQLDNKPTAIGGARTAANEEKSAGSPDLANWRKLRKGMSKDEVMELLGQPVQTVSWEASPTLRRNEPPKDPACELWLYEKYPRVLSPSRGEIEGSLNVSFVKFDESEHVKVWREPRRP